MIDPAKIRTGFPSTTLLVGIAITLLIAGAIVGAGIVTLIWSPP